MKLDGFMDALYEKIKYAVEVKNQHTITTLYQHMDTHLIDFLDLQKDRQIVEDHSKSKINDIIKLLNFEMNEKDLNNNLFEAG